MKRGIAQGLAVAFALATAGCVGDGTGTAPASLQISTPPAPPAAPSMGGFLEGAIGAKLSEADRQAAFKAETAAVASGDRKTWRGSSGTYGFVVPGAVISAASAEAGGSECRSFTHTVYLSGRPQVGRGTGCRGADGDWRIAG